MNYYDVLGVDPTASTSDIKSAFRAKAKQSHPDHGGNADNFRKLNEAYDVLKDTNKRAQYDSISTGSGGIHININGKQHDIFSDVFRDLNAAFGDAGPFAQTRSYHRQSKNKDLSITVHLKLADSLVKQDRTIKVTHINGETRMVKVTIPAGTMPGDSIRYAGLGDHSNTEQRPGNLFINVTFTDQEKYEISGTTVKVNCTINAIDAIIGTSVTVYDIENKKYTVSVPKGTQHGTVMRIPQKGLLDKRTGLRGDLTVNILTQIPTNLTVEQLNILKSIRDEKE